MRTLKGSVMRFIGLIWMGLSALIVSQATHAQDRSEVVQPLRFSAKDQRLIQRNQLLRELVPDDPIIVRKILNLLTDRSSAEIAPGRGANPDLLDLNRDFPKELSDMVVLAQSMMDQRTAKTHRTSRSPEGSIEYIEMMKRAKAAKDAAAGPANIPITPPPIGLEERILLR